MAENAFRIAGKQWWFLYSPQHGWGCETGDGPLWFKERNIFVPLLPLLEHPFASAQELVKNSGVGSEASESFPFEETLLCALNWETDSWAPHALSWLETDYPLTKALIATLRSIAEKKNFSQQVRHRAFALAKRWEKNNA
jgi:hypothetical protein